ncbi:MAG: hypothetical protein PHQ75_09085, partial [Thermoguttaceae bacterium]|nr:hypothetical protein [Thermoguttaceae bacterium]
MSAQATGLTDGSTTQVRVFFNAFQIVNDQAVSTVAGDFVPSITVSGVTCNAIEDTNDLDGDVRTTHYFDFDCTVGNNGASLTASVSDGTNSGTVDLAAGITLAAQSTLYNSSASHLRVIATAGNTFDATADIAKKSDTSPCYQNIPQYKILTGWLSVSQVGKDVTLKCSCITGVSSYKFEFKVNSFTDVNGNGYYDSKDTLGPEIVPWTTVNHNASGYTLSTLEIGQIVTWQVTAIGTENYASSDIGIATSTQGYNPFMVKDYLLEPAGFTVVQQPSYYYKLDWNDAVTKNGNAFTPSFSVYYTIEGLNNADGTPKRFNATKSDKISENTINISYANQQYTIAGKKILFEVTAVGNSAAAGIAGSPTAYYEYTIVDNLTAPDMTVQSKTEDSIVVTWNAVPNA